MKAVNFFTMNDWDMKNKNFQALSKGLNAIEEEVIKIFYVIILFYLLRGRKTSTPENHVLFHFCTFLSNEINKRMIH